MRSKTNKKFCFFGSFCLCLDESVLMCLEDRKNNGNRIKLCLLHDFHGSVVVAVVFVSDQSKLLYLTI